LPESWYSQSIDRVMSSLQVTPAGLGAREARERLTRYGPNELVAKKGRSALRMFLDEFRDVFILLLVSASALSAILGETADATVIGAIVILVALTGFIQEYRAEKAIEAMRKLTAPKAHVVREGKDVVLPAREIVPGDVLVLESGDLVAADARLLEAVELKTGEAVLTGESAPVDKGVATLEDATAISERRNMVFAPTHVVYGRGRAVVTSTGMGTEFGKIAEIVQAEREEAPPLQRKLDQFAKKMAKVVVVVVVTIFALEVFEVAARGRIVASGFTDALLSSISLAISAVPEGLPAIVTVALALGAREFARRNAIVRRLSSAESLGAVTVICSDKTGTITRGEMTVRELYLNGAFVEVTGIGYQPSGEAELGGNLDLQEDARSLLRIGALCNNAKLRRREGEGAWEVMGDPTEGALIVSAAKVGLDKDALDAEYPRLREVPFTSERKLMTTVHRTPDNLVVSCAKGAPEMILERCTRILANGRAEELTEAERSKILQANERLAGNALRVLAMAYKQLPSDGAVESAALEEGLVFAGLQGMIDPPRDEAVAANATCRRAGIRTVMITGDQRPTAVAVARDVGILEEGGIILTGVELDELGDAAFDETVEKVAVYARVSPEHKLRIVKAWKRRGHVVAMTGDGVNDAPALKAADVGVSMGITGTDVTKEASDLILVDDNFASIVKAVEQGRVIYDNIRKYARFLIACNFDELAVIGLFALLGGIYGAGLFPLPLSAAMILWINLVTDGAPAVALATDPPDVDVMDRPPRNPSEGILHGMGRFVAASFILQAFGTILVFSLEYFVWPAHGFGTEETLREARTAAFVQAVLFELMVVWNCRSEKRSVWRMGKDALKNRSFVLAEVVSVAASMGIVYLPITQGLFGLYPLSLRDFAYVLGVAGLGLLVFPEVTMNKRLWRWE
jgi:P-type Ca2+ transporter type 2C